MSDINSPNNGGTGGLLHNAGGIGVAVIAGFLFWPALIPFSGTGENWKILPINYILLVAWWVFLILAACVRAGYRGEPGQQDPGQTQHYQDHHGR